MKSFKLRYDEKKAKEKLKKKFDKIIESSEWKEKAEEYIITNVQGSTRLQKRAKDNKPLKKISEQHKKNKKELIKYNQEGKSFGANKSNLTITGQLLESLKGKHLKRSVEVSPKGDRTPYKTKNGQVKKTPTNEELTGYLKEMGYEFLGLSKKMKKQLKKIIKDEFFRKFNGS